MLLGAIRGNRPHNEVKRAAQSNLAAMMGRAAVHMGRTIAWEEIAKSEFRFCPQADALTENSPAPVQADDGGRYQAPIPGKWVEV